MTLIRNAGRLLSIPVSVLVTACAGEAGGAGRWVAEQDTVGDTVVVRTLAGGEWGDPAVLTPVVRVGVLEGEDVYLLGRVTGLAVDAGGAAYVYDSQVPALRKYDRDGRYEATFGRSGGGPGEYKNSDGGLAVLPDGRIVLRDQGNARFQLWTPTGEPAGEWRYIGGFFTSAPLFVDTAGRLHSSIVDFASPPPLRTMLVRYDPAGLPLDTLTVPTSEYETPRIVAQRIVDGENRGTMINSVPFSPAAHWTFSPFGYFVGGVSTRYGVNLYRPEGTLRIERVIEAVPVEAAEKSNAEEAATANMRGLVSDWRWNGPPIPDTKPPFTGVVVAEDGRIWVQLSQPGERIPDDELEPVRPGSGPSSQRRWRDPIAWDVFEPDGRYVGLVRAPTGFSTHPRPVIRGDTVWAIATDPLGVQQLVRFQVTHAK